MFRKMVISTAVLSAAFFNVNVFASETDYPSKPIHIVVPVTPAGTSDFFARLVGQRLSENIKVPVVIENRPGASGINGSLYAARAAADGYTLLLASGGTHSINPILYKELPYDAIGDFEPVIRIATTTNVLVVNPKLPVNSVSELEEYLKKNPAGHSFASSGKGTSLQLAGEMFKNAVGVDDFVHIPYSGSAPAVMSLLAGTVTLMFDNVPSALPQIKAGKLKALVVTDSVRSDSLPSVPTMAESGLDGFEMNTWFGLLAPKGTSAASIAYLNKEISKVLQDKDVQAQIQEKGAKVAGNSTVEFKQFMNREIEKWTRIAKAAKVEAE